MPLQMGRWAKGLVVAGMLLGLSACGETKLLGRSLPDETRVVDGPGLDLPPDFSLRAPEDASEAALRRTAQTSRSAQEIFGIGAVSGTAETSTGAVPAGDQWLLEQAGGRVDPNIREDLSEAPVEAEEGEKPGLLKRWFGK